MENEDERNVKSAATMRTIIRTRRSLMAEKQKQGEEQNDNKRKQNETHSQHGTKNRNMTAYIIEKRSQKGDDSEVISVVADVHRDGGNNNDAAEFLQNQIIK